MNEYLFLLSKEYTSMNEKGFKVGFTWKSFYVQKIHFLFVFELFQTQPSSANLINCYTLSNYFNVIESTPN